jgi:hypothetical protein
MFGFFRTAPIGEANVTDIASNKLQQFYRVPVITYPNIFAPAAVAGKRVLLNFARGTFAGSSTVELALNTIGNSGTTQAGASSGTITQYSWSPYPTNRYGASLVMLFSNEVRFDVYTLFTSPTGGTFSGKKYTVPDQLILGTFTIQDAAQSAQLSTADGTTQKRARRQVSRSTRRTR